MKRTKKWRFLLLLVVMVMSMSTQVFAATDEDPKFDLTLPAGGLKDQTGLELKEDTYNYARIEFEHFVNNDSLTCYVRLRDDGAHQASVAYEVNSVCTMRPYYYNGYGIMGEYYFFRMQTDSNSTQGARTWGIWVP